MGKFVRFTPDQINAVTDRLNTNALSLARDLFPEGFCAGGMYWPRNHTRNDRHPGSMYVHIKGPKMGGWCEHVGDVTGNSLQLIAYAKGWDRARDFPKMMNFAYDWLSMERPVPQDIERRADHKPVAAFNPEKNRQWIRKLWLDYRKDAASGKMRAHTLSDLRGTPGGDYLLSRGIDLNLLPKPPGAVRFDPKARYYTARGVFHAQPAILSLMIDQVHYQARALHRTYLTETGQKYHGADGDLSAKKWLGKAQGAFVPLARGENGAAIKEAMATGLADDLAISEGLEDGLSAALVRPDFRVWMAGTQGNMAKLSWPDCAPAVHLILQNEGNDQALAAQNKVIHHWRKESRGRPLFIHLPPSGIKDINDWLAAAIGAP